MIALGALTGFPGGEIVDIADPKAKTFALAQFRWYRPGVLHKDQDGLWTSTLGWTGRPDGTRFPFFISPAATSNQRKETLAAFRLMLLRRYSKAAAALSLLAISAARRQGSSSIVVLFHGAEGIRTRVVCAPTMLPAENIGAFVYDKRGTGGSEGSSAGSRYLQITPWRRCEKPDGSLARAAPESDIRAAVRAAGSHHLPQHARRSISLLSFRDGCFCN